ncbi:MAG: hypothetical protein HYT79_06005 [Elusimicrobia bacterium]|nr:hypothetical protein [Elusimicrobiota bacterium]
MRISASAFIAIAAAAVNGFAAPGLSKNSRGLDKELIWAAYHNSAQRMEGSARATGSDATVTASAVRPFRSAGRLQRVFIEPPAGAVAGALAVSMVPPVVGNIRKYGFGGAFRKIPGQEFDFLLFSFRFMGGGLGGFGGALTHGALRDKIGVGPSLGLSAAVSSVAVGLGTAIIDRQIGSFPMGARWGLAGGLIGAGVVELTRRLRGQR